MSGVTGVAAGVRRRRRPAGQSVVEFAVSLPLILLIFFGAIDLGRGVFAYNTLAQAARAGNRVAIVNQTTAEIQARAVASAATLGLTSANVTVCYKTGQSTQQNCAAPTVDNCPQATRAIGCLAIVTTRLTYQPMTPVINLLWSSITLSSTSIGPIEHVCPEVGTTCTFVGLSGGTP